MSRNLRSRIEKLERRTNTGPSRKIWSVLLGMAPIEELDEADRLTLRRLEADRRERLGQQPVLICLRQQWTRLGMADPGQYDGLDLIAEAIRLAGIPTPSALPCGMPELPANEPAHHETP